MTRAATGIEQMLAKWTQLLPVFVFKWLAVLLLSGCASTHVEVAMGPELNPPWNRSSNNWRGDGPIVDAAIRTEGERTFCEYRHTSNLFSHGADETWLDRVTCGIKLQIRE